MSWFRCRFFKDEKHIVDNANNPEMLRGMICELGEKLDAKENFIEELKKILGEFGSRLSNEHLFATYERHLNKCKEVREEKDEEIERLTHQNHMYERTFNGSMEAYGFKTIASVDKDNKIAELEKQLAEAKKPKDISHLIAEGVNVFRVGEKYYQAEIIQKLEKENAELKAFFEEVRSGRHTVFKERDELKAEIERLKARLCIAACTAFCQCSGCMQHRAANGRCQYCGDHPHLGNCPRR